MSLAARDEGRWETLFEGRYEREPVPEPTPEPAPVPGRIGWSDLTVEDAPAIRDFWAAVAGWRPEPVSMGEYSDFNMVAAGPRGPAGGRVAVVRDQAGATLALWESKHS
jgi:predicted enzyme related to lactoylglutathione lyase